MPCPQPKDLPPPREGRRDWPWSRRPPSLPDRTRGGGAWPRVSIVTPSYNQGRFLEETIRSVLLQGYPDLEYIVMDGGSEDESVDIIRKYAPWISHWESGKDRGQSHAINKGLACATGEVFAFLNSDDIYLPGALATVGQWWASEGGSFPWLCSSVEVQGDQVRAQTVSPAFRDDPSHFIAGWGDIHQVGTFYGLALVRAVKGFPEESRYVFDRDLWIRLMLEGHLPRVRPDWCLGRVRMHGESKTVAEAEHFERERAELPAKYRPLLCPTDQKRLDASLREREFLRELSVHSADRRVASCLKMAARRPRMLLRRFTWGAIMRAVLPGPPGADR